MVLFQSRPRARETAATYKNQFMSASLSKKVVGISRIANFQELKDTSDLKELSVQDALFLKPIAQMNISVSIPAIVNKRNQKAISNWEVMERLKAMVAPREFTHIKVRGSSEKNLFYTSLCLGHQEYFGFYSVRGRSCQQTCDGGYHIPCGRKTYEIVRLPRALQDQMWSR